jgi:hypothetical protein
MAPALPVSSHPQFAPWSLWSFGVLNPNLCRKWEGALIRGHPYILDTGGNSSFATGFSVASILIPRPLQLDKHPTFLCVDDIFEFLDFYIFRFFDFRSSSGFCF